MREKTVGYLSNGERSFPILHWEGYGFVCPRLFTTNGYLAETADFIRNKISAGWTFSRGEDCEETTQLLSALETK